MRLRMVLKTIFGKMLLFLILTLFVHFWPFWPFLAFYVFIYLDYIFFQGCYRKRTSWVWWGWGWYWRQSLGKCFTWRGSWKNSTSSNPKQIWTSYFLIKCCQGGISCFQKFGKCRWNCCWTIKNYFLYAFISWSCWKRWTGMVVSVVEFQTWGIQN